MQVALPAAASTCRNLVTTSTSREATQDSVTHSAALWKSIMSLRVPTIKNIVCVVTVFWGGWGTEQRITGAVSMTVRVVMFWAVHSRTGKGDCMIYALMRPIKIQVTCRNRVLRPGHILHLQMDLTQSRRRLTLQNLRTLRTLRIRLEMTMHKTRRRT